MLCACVNFKILVSVLLWAFVQWHFYFLQYFWKSCLLFLDLCVIKYVYSLVYSCVMSCYHLSPLMDQSTNKSYLSHHSYYQLGYVCMSGISCQLSIAEQVQSNLGVTEHSCHQRSWNIPFKSHCYIIDPLSILHGRQISETSRISCMKQLIPSNTNKNRQAFDAVRSREFLECCF